MASFDPENVSLAITLLQIFMVPNMKFVYSTFLIIHMIVAGYEAILLGLGILSS